jgi:hypothetical protein
MAVREGDDAGFHGGTLAGRRATLTVTGIGGPALPPLPFGRLGNLPRTLGRSREESEICHVAATHRPPGKSRPRRSAERDISQTQLAGAVGREPPDRSARSRPASTARPRSSPSAWRLSCAARGVPVLDRRRSSMNRLLPRDEREMGIDLGAIVSPSSCSFWNPRDRRLAGVRRQGGLVGPARPARA